MTYFQRLRFNLVRVGLNALMAFNLVVFIIALESDKTHDQMRLFFKHTFFEYLGLTAVLALIASFIKNERIYQKGKIEETASSMLGGYILLMLLMLLIV